MSPGNPISYAGNNPANFNDPYGKDSYHVVLGPTGIAVGGDAYKNSPPSTTFGVKDGVWIKESDVWRLYKWVPIPDPPEPPEPAAPPEAQPPAEDKKPTAEPSGSGVPNQGNHQQGTGSAAPPAPAPPAPAPPVPPPGGPPTVEPAIEWIERVLELGGEIPNLPPFVDQYLKGLAAGAGAAGHGGAGILRRHECKLACLCALETMKAGTWARVGDNCWCYKGLTGRDLYRYDSRPPQPVY